MLSENNLLARFSDDSSESENNKWNVGIQTNSWKKKDNFMQTEHHGYIEIKNLLGRNHNISRKLSSKTAVGFLNNTEQSVSEHKYSEGAHTELKRSQTKRFDDSYKTGKLIKNIDYNAIQNVINSESESISDSTIDKGEIKRDFDNVSKIVVAPLERITTIKTTEIGDGQNTISKVVDAIIPVERNRMTRNEKLKPVQSNPEMSKQRATTTRLVKKNIVELSPNYLQLQGEKIKQVMVKDRYRKNLASREWGLVSTLGSDQVSRKTSIDDAKETMTAVYDTGNYSYFYEYRNKS